jgi:hypothetical protein
VDERDLQAEEALPRLLVDQLDAGVAEPCQRLRDVVDLVRDVVHPRAAPGEEPTDERVFPEGLEQFDATRADAYGGRVNALRRHGRALLELRAEQARVRRERRVEVVDRDAEVVDPPGVHGAMLAAARSVSGQCDDDRHADRLGGMRLGLHVAEKPQDLLPYERLLLEQGARHPVE